MSEPKIIQGKLFHDDRGYVSFTNELNFSELGIKRYYTVRNHSKKYSRRFHGHKKEAKYVTVNNGAAKIVIYKVADWDNGTPVNESAKVYNLSWTQPDVLYIPPGYANGFVPLNEDAIITFYSTSSLEESKGDDFRFNEYILSNLFKTEIR